MISETIKALPPSDAVDVIRFSLDVPTPLLNVTLREHWTQRQRRARVISAEVYAKTLAQRPLHPFPRARVTITRRSIGRPDRDGLIGGVKFLVDSLLPASTKHPYGLGFVADDNDQCMDLVVTPVAVRSRSQQGTDVLIERLPLSST